MNIPIILTLLVSVYCVECANILYVVPFTSKSHNIMLKPIGLELARRGHNVTVITGHCANVKLPNYHEVKIEVKEIWDVLGIERPNVFSMTQITAEEFHDLIFWRGGLGFTEMALNSTQFQQFVNSDNHYDLVISEQFFQEAMYSLAHKYRTPLALVTTFGNCMRHNIAARNPLQQATVVSEFLDLKDPTSFWARLRNFYFSVYEYVWWKYWYLGQQEDLARKYIPGLPSNMPSLYEMQRNVSLFLSNSHFSFDPPVAYLPNIVEIGGVHLTHSTEKLPKDLQKILDESKNGVIYMNFGSNVRSSELPLEKKKAFLNIFSELKQTILWKWEDDNIEDMPRNLIIRKWFPQKEILAHPNIRLFISHGGLIGTQEAIFHGVPIIGVPIYADQYNNLLQVQEKGFGRILQYQDIEEDILRRTLNDVLNNNSYSEQAKIVSERFNDRPMNGLDTAMFWIEYVIRNNGADFLKNPALQLSWVAYNMLDVYAFVFLVLVVPIYLILKAVSLLRSPKEAKKYKYKTN